jgi:putative CocE/NonD family hydrolase
MGLAIVGSHLYQNQYNFVIADWRGFYGSASAYVANYNRGLDGYDLVEWIAQQTWSNGKIGTWGPSALGKIQYQTAKENPPHLTCCVPIVAFPQMTYQEYYPGGVYRTEYVQQLDNLGYGLSPWLLANPFYNFQWQYVESTTNYPSAIKVSFIYDWRLV